MTFVDFFDFQLTIGDTKTFMGGGGGFGGRKVPPKRKNLSAEGGLQQVKWKNVPVARQNQNKDINLRIGIGTQLTLQMTKIK